MSTLQLQGSFGMDLLKQSITLALTIRLQYSSPAAAGVGVYSFQTTISLSSLHFATLEFKSLSPYPSLSTSFDG